jgi:choline dehydrogenase
LERLSFGARFRRDEKVAFVRRACSSYFHPVGTCAMGSGREAVVDAELRVHGIEGLRIADASVMPTIPSANTNAPTVMIGEFASQLLLVGSSALVSAAKEAFIVQMQTPLH